MKRILLAFLFVSVFCCSSSAQNISTHASDIALQSGGYTVVRSCDANYVVSYYVSSSQVPSMEVYDIPSGTTYYAELPDDVFIMDMHIEQSTKTIYFCGSTDYYSYYPGHYYGTGIVGWIEMSDFFTSNVTVNYTLLDDPGATINRVTKLVEYDNGGVPQIVAIGEYLYPYGNYIYSKQYFVDCYDITGGPTWNIAPFPTNEHYYDVMLTANYLVLMGGGINPGVASICYRKTDPYNLYDPMLDDIHLFYNGNDNLSVTHSTAMFGDEMATSYLALNGGGDFVTRIRVMDIGSDVNTYSQDFLLSDKSEPDGIVHIPADNSLVVMQRFDTFNGMHNSNFVYIDPYAVMPYTTVLEYRPGEYFESLTQHEFVYYLAGAGASWFFKDKTQPPTGWPNQSCPEVEDFKAEPTDNIDPYTLNYSITPSPYYPTQVNSYQPVLSSLVNIDCSNY